MSMVYKELTDTPETRQPDAGGSTPTDPGSVIRLATDARLQTGGVMFNKDTRAAWQAAGGVPPSVWSGIMVEFYCPNIPTTQDVPNGEDGWPAHGRAKATGANGKVQKGWRKLAHGSLGSTGMLTPVGAAMLGAKERTCSAFAIYMDPPQGVVLGEGFKLQPWMVHMDSVLSVRVYVPEVDNLEKLKELLVVASTRAFDREMLVDTSRPGKSYTDTLNAALFGVINGWEQVAAERSENDRRVMAAVAGIAGEGTMVANERGLRLTNNMPRPEAWVAAPTRGVRNMAAGARSVLSQLWSLTGGAASRGAIHLTTAALTAALGDPGGQRPRPGMEPLWNLLPPFLHGGIHSVKSNERGLRLTGNLPQPHPSLGRSRPAVYSEFRQTPRKPASGGGVRVVQQAAQLAGGGTSGRAGADEDAGARRDAATFRAETDGGGHGSGPEGTRVFQQAADRSGRGSSADRSGRGSSA